MIAETITAVLIFIFYIIKTTVAARMSVISILPDFVMVLVICYAIWGGKEKGVLMAVVVGVFVDIAGGGGGKFTAVYMFSAAAAGMFGSGLFGKNFITAAVISLIISLVYGIISAICAYILKTDMATGSYIICKVIPFTIGNGICAAIFYPIIDAAGVSYRRYG